MTSIALTVRGKVRWSGWLAIVFAFSLAACGGGGGTKTDAGTGIDAAGNQPDGGVAIDAASPGIDASTGLTCPTAAQVDLGPNNLDGGTFTVSLRSLAVDSTNVYTDVLSAQLFHDSVLAVPLAGSSGTPIITNGSLFYLATDGSFVYVIDGRTGSAVLARAPVGGGTRQTYTSPAQPTTFVLDGTTLVAASATQVWAQPAGNTAATVTAFVTNGTRIEGVAAGGGFIDYIDQGSGTSTGVVNQISEASGGTPTPLATGQSAPISITVAGGMVFWTTIDHMLHAVSQTPGGTAKVLASNAETTTADGLTGIASDGTNVYYSASVSSHMVLAKVPVNGGAVSVVGCNGPPPFGPSNPIALDATHVYWTDGFRLFKAPK